MLSSQSAKQQAKSTIVKVLCSEPVGKAIQATTGGHVRNRGARFDVSEWEPHLASAVAFGLYERSEARFALRYLAHSERVLELGGSRGVVSSILLQALPSSAQLVSVEANPSLVPELKRNLARNSGGRTAQARHFAVSDGGMVLFDSSKGSLGSSLSMTSGDPVPITTLGDLVASLDWADFSLLSDIEGAEATFILGDGTGLERCKRMVIELHKTSFAGKAVSVQDLLTALTDKHDFIEVDRHKDVSVLVRG